MKGLTIGQYYPADSVLHELDPRTKLLGTVVLISSLFICNNIASYVLATLFLISVIVMSKVPISYMFRGIKGIIVILLFSVSFHLFFTKGEKGPDLFTWKIVNISVDGIVKATYMGLRLAYLIIGSSLLTLTTTPNNLTDGMELGLRWLKKIKIPVHEMAMMMSIALRFIPILVEETDKIMKAQIARGADFESGNVFKRAKNLVPLMVPLFVSAFRRASDLAMAMESRCYHGGDGRTKMYPLHYKKQDAVAFVVMFLYLALVIVAAFVLPKLFPALLVFAW